MLFDAEGLVFAYPGRPRVLDGASLTLDAGERVCVLGPNGAGKSTLLKLLVGLLTPQAGRLIAFGAEPRTEEAFRAVRLRAGFVFQDPDDQLFCPTVLEDVAFGPLNMDLPRDLAVQRATAALAQVGLAGFGERITHKLSGGERRLVSLAAVLAMGPEVLLLDEPTNALDEGITARLVEILLSLDVAMIIVSHDSALRAQLATRSLRLSSGVLTPA